MPNTCRTDTFISGKPVISCALVMAAVVINPPRSRAFPKPDLRYGCGYGLEFSLAESNGRQKSAIRSKFRCLFIEIGVGRVLGRLPCESRRIFVARSGPVSDRPLALFVPATTYGG